MRGEHRHEAARGVDVGTLFEREEGLEAAGDAGVAERDAIGEAQGAHHDVVDGPRTESAEGEERALGAGGGHEAKRFEVERAVGDEAREGDDVVGFLTGELEREKIAGFEGGDGGGRGWEDEAVGEAGAGEFEEAAFEEAGEREIDLLADDGPEESVVERRRAGDAEFGAAGDEAGEAEFAGEAGEGGGVVVEAEEGDDDGVGFDGGGCGLLRKRGRKVGADFVGREMEREEGGMGGKLEGGGVGVGFEAFVDAVRIAAEGAAEIAEEEAGRQRELEGIGGGERAEGGGREAVEAAEIFVENGKGFETGGVGDFGERVRGGEEIAFRGVEAGAEKEIGGGGVKVKAEEFERAGGAEAEAFDDGAGVGESGGILAEFGDDGFDGFENGVGAAGEIVGVAFLARTEAGGAGGFAGGEEADVFELGFPGLAGREAVDAGGEDAEEEPAVAGGVAGEDALIHRGGGEARGAERFHRGKVGREWAGGNHGNGDGRTVAGSGSGVVRLSSVQFFLGLRGGVGRRGQRLEAITDEGRGRWPHGGRE